MAVDDIKSFDDSQRTVVFDCIRDYCPDLIAEMTLLKLVTRRT